MVRVGSWPGHVTAPSFPTRPTNCCSRWPGITPQPPFRAPASSRRSVELKKRCPGRAATVRPGWRFVPALPPVLGDRVQLQQVLLNLVMNGIEAMAAVTDRPRELLIRSHPHEAAQVLVAVQDTGVGIDPNDLDQLFSAFFTTKPAGMGMGLSISRSIVEAHGGRLWATPNEPHGAIFHFSLPVGPAPALASIAPGSRPSAS